MWVQSTVVCPKWGGMFLIDVCICWCHNVISCSRGTLFELWAQRWLCKIIVEFRVHTIVRLLVINSSYYYYIEVFPRNRRSTYICNIYIDIPVYIINYDSYDLGYCLFEPQWYEGGRRISEREKMNKNILFLRALIMF